MQNKIKKTSTISFSTTNYKPEIEQEYEYHTVVAGETLYSISKYYNKSINTIIRLNNLSAPYTLEIGQKLKISKKIKKTTISILQQIELTEKLKQRIKAKSPSEFNSTAELELSYLMSLQKVCDKINTQNQQTRFRTWLNKQAKKQLLEYSNGKWLVNSEKFWTLHDKYYPLPISDKIDWQAAENLKMGNCDFECSLDWLNQTTVTYLKYHPTGKYVDQALNKILAFTNKYKTKTSLLNTKNLPRLFAVIHLTVGRTNHRNTDRVLGEIDRLRELLH